MREKYKELFENVHLSEKTVDKIREMGEKDGDKKKKERKGRRTVKAAVLIGAVLIFGASGAGAAISIHKAGENRRRMDGQVENKKARITVQMAEKDNSVSKSRKDALYDVKLSYLPEGYAQDKTDTYLYREKDGEGYFSVILYHLKAEYRAFRAADKLKTFRSGLGQGYYGGRGKGYFAILAFSDTDYMVYIDGSNMPEAEVKKIAQGASLAEVSKAEDIQASRIEWTEKRKKETEEFIARMNQGRSE